MKIHSFILASAFATCSSAGLAQQATADSTNPAAVPAMNCESPGDSAGIEPNYAQLQRFQKKIDVYKLCVNDYAKVMGAKASEHADLAKTYTNAANGAIESYNSYVTALNAKQKGADPSGDPRSAPTSGTSKPKY